MTQFLALLRLQLLTRFADLKPKNLKNALRDKRGRTVGMMIAFIILFVYLGVILYIVETKALEYLTKMNMPDLLPVMAVMLSTAGTLIMAFFFIMSSLYLGRDAAFLASLPIKPRTMLGAKLTQVWISESLIDAVILLPACILYGTRTGQGADFYLRLAIVWLFIAIIPIAIAAVLSAFLIRISALWKHREIILTVGGIGLFVAYMILMMNVGSITGDSAEGGAMIQKFLTDNAVRISGMTKFFPPAAWAANGLNGDWGQLALFVGASIATGALLVAVLGIFYRKLSLLQSETPTGRTGKKGVRKGSIQEESAYRANVKRELMMILRVPSYAVNILPIAFMPLVMVIMMSVMFNRSAGQHSESLISVFSQINPALVMCILAAVVAFMAGMNPALSTAVSREGKGHEFVKALPVTAKTMIGAKLTVGFGIVVIGVISASIAILIVVPGFTLETLLAMVLCLIFTFGTSCQALARDIKNPKLDWVTEQEAVKQNMGMLVSMLVSWGLLGVLAVACYLMLSAGWATLPVFAVLAVLLCAFAGGMYKLLDNNTKKYYFAG